MKAYDQAYFDRWYRHPAHRVSTAEGLGRKVRLALSMAEYLLARSIRSVLDIGCGEAPWYPMLRRLRPKVRYIGVDSSEYVLERFGARRNIRRGHFAELDALKLPKRVDLVVCADVVQYLTDRELERGLRAIRRLVTGIAFIEAFTTEDAMEGDRDGWNERSATEFRKLFRRAGLQRCGPHCYLDPAKAEHLDVFEHGGCDWGRRRGRGDEEDI